MTDAPRLRLFGDFSLDDSSGRPVALHLRKAEALLAYLALAPGQSSSRDMLATLLWSESDQQRARQSLRQVLFALTKAFAQHELPLLHLETQSVRLTEGALRVDAVELQRLLEDGSEDALKEACGLYGGEFLSGFNIGAPAFEEWLSDTRGLFRDVMMRALTQLLQEQEASGRLEQVIDTAGRALRIEPYREDIHRRLMQIYAAKGMRSSALGQYRKCRDILERELGVQPDEETTKLYHRILQQGGEDREADGGGEAAPGEAAHLAERIVRLTAASDGLSVGRERELTQLKDLLAEVGGGGRLALVSGESGVGKSHVLNAFAYEAARAGTPVLMGRGQRAQGGLAFDLWTDVLKQHPVRPVGDGEGADPGAATLGRLMRTLRPSGRVGEEPDPREAYEAVVELLRERAGDAGLAVVLDDIHRADDASLRLLHYVARNLRLAPVLIVVAVAADARVRRLLLRDVLRDLEGDGLCAPIDLEPLSRKDSIDLAWQLQQVLEVKRDTKARLDRLWLISEGNPRVIREAVLSGAAQDGSPHGGEPALPTGVLDEVASRKAGLGEAAQRVMSVAAVIGRRADYRVLVHAAALADERAAEAVEELVAERILTIEAEDAVFVHRRVALAVYEDLLAPRRRLLHAAVARAMEAVHAAAPESHYQEIERHWRLAGEDRKALAFELEAARLEIDRGSSAAARRGFQRTVESARRVEGDAQVARAEIDAHLELAALAEMEEDGDRVAASLDAAEALVRPQDGPQRLAAIYAGRARLHWVRGAEDQAYALTRRALAEAERGETPSLRLASESLLAHLHLAGGAGRRPRGRMQRRREHSARLGLRRDTADTAAVLGLLHAVSGSFAEATRCCDEAIEIAEAIVDETYMTACLQARGVVECWRGFSAAALASFDKALDLARARGDLPRLCALTGFRGYALLSAGRKEEAAATLCGALALGKRMNAHLFEALFKAWLAESAVEMVADEDALRLGREALRQACDGNQDWARSIALRALARVMARPGYRDLHAADSTIRSAIAIQDGLGLRCEIARSLVVRAKILRARGNARQSSEIFMEAGEMFEQMGMAADFDRAHTMAEALRPEPA